MGRSAPLHVAAVVASLGSACGLLSGHGRAPGAPSATPRTAPAPVSTEGRHTFTIAATGDLLPHLPVIARAGADGAASGRAYDFGPMLAPIAPVVSRADLAICHVETPLSATDRDLAGYPVFNSPHELADAVAAAGFDECSTASNHSLDQGASGVTATIDALNAAGVAPVGTARNATEAATPVLRRVGGLTVAHLAYTYGLNGFRRPPAQPWLVNLIDPERILADARVARAAGAGFVVVSLHWGEEYQAAATPAQRALAGRLLASPDVDLVIGSHVHVIQPVERIGDKYVVYGMGNLLSNQTTKCCPAASQDGVVVLVSVDDRAGPPRVGAITYVPTWVEPVTYRVLAVARALDDPATPAAERPELEASWRRTVAAISALGADGIGVVPADVGRSPFSSGGPTTPITRG